MLARLRFRLLDVWATAVCRYPWWVLTVTALVTVASIGVTITRLEFQSDRNALLSPHLDWNQRFEQWRASFPGNEDFYIVIDSTPAPGSPAPGNPDPGSLGGHHPAAARALIDELGPMLAASEHVESAVWSFDQGGFSPKALRLATMDEFQAQLDRIARAKPLLASPTPRDFFAALIRAFRNTDPEITEGEAVASIDELSALIDAFTRVLSTPPDQRPTLEAMIESPASNGETSGGNATAKPTPRPDPHPSANPVSPSKIYLTSGNDRLYFIRVTPRKADGALNAFEPAIQAIRGLIDQARSRHPRVEVGLTGIDVVETDETEAATRDSTVASVIAVVLITGLLITAFHSWVNPLLAMVALLSGVAWSFGLVSVTIGHLQVISVVFTVILLGLGIAYGIHLLSRIELVRHRYGDDRAGFHRAVRNAFHSVGPGVVTGAVTTAAAFVMTVFTDFIGVAEMGIIAAMGIFLCLAAMLSVYPALLCVWAWRQRCYEPMKQRRVHFFEDRWVAPFWQHPKATLAVAALVTVASVAVISRMRFDYDLMNLQPRGVESVVWQQRIVDDGGESIWTALRVVDSLEKARDLKRGLLELPTVAKVAGIGLLYPHDDDQKVRMLRETTDDLRPWLGSLDQPPQYPPQRTPDLETQLPFLRVMVTVAGRTEAVTPAVRSALKSLGTAIDRLLGVLTSLKGDDKDTQLTQLSHEYGQWRQHTRDRLVEVFDTSPLTPDDLPHELLLPYIATAGPLAGQYVLEVHPKLPSDGSVTTPLDPKFLPRFIGDVGSVTQPGKPPFVTGVVVQIYESGWLIKTSYMYAGAYALAVVFVLVWLDFRSVRSAGLSLVPVAVGFAATFAVMWLVGMSVNPANIIVLPLMFGIGVDSGVHILHRYRQNPSQRPLGLANGTGKGITVTSLTTMIGFGAMILARHRGISSLGFVLTVGIGLTLLACWTVMPAWLQLRGAGRLRHEQGGVRS